MHSATFMAGLGPYMALYHGAKTYITIRDVEKHSDATSVGRARSRHNMYRKAHTMCSWASWRFHKLHRQALCVGFLYILEGHERTLTGFMRTTQEVYRT